MMNERRGVLLLLLVQPGAPRTPHLPQDPGRREESPTMMATFICTQNASAGAVRRACASLVTGRAR